MTPKLHTLSRVCAAVLLLAATAAQAVAPTQPRPAYREGEVVVKYRKGASADEVRRLHSRLGMVARRNLDRGRADLLQLPRVTTTAAALALLRAEPAIAIAEPNALRYPRIACPDNAGFFCPNDALFAEQWGLRSTGQINYADPDPALASIPGADLDLLLAWDPGADGTFERVGSAGVTIAILDTGVSTSHPDLAANIVAGYDFADDDNDPNPNDSFEAHGTFVAGAAGAVGNNGIGVAGTAWNSKLMPLKFNFDSASHVAALAFARDNGAKIVNASFGGPFFSQAELDALLDLDANGILYVASSGNDDSNTDLAQLNFPSNFEAPNIVSVAATNRQDNIASFSQYGAITTDVAAPGLQIVTTTSIANGYTTPSDCATTGNCGVSGTSFSAPYVSGIAALILSAHPGATPAEIKARLIESGEAGDGDGDLRLRTAGGRVNAAQAIDLAPRPSLVVSGTEFIDGIGGNSTLDPGESLQVQIALDNLWQDATNVMGTLTADNGVTVTSGAVSFGAIAGGASAAATFDATVAAAITEHRYVRFTLVITADGGYAATRGFLSEIGRLATDTLVTQAFVPRAVDLYDEYHAWHYDFDGVLPAGHTQLVIETTSTAPGVNSPDIDLLVKKGQPPQYNITIGIDPSLTPGFFCTSATALDDCMDPAVNLSAGLSGSEQVVINNPTAGTFHAVVVNFAALEGGLTYTLRAYTRAAPGNVGGGGGGGGGRVPVLALAALLVAALARRFTRVA
ncbi:MAG: S8 family serine peptidase [Gammaproteobacteria bacterium]